jgi:hypothetical protein
MQNNTKNNEVAARRTFLEVTVIIPNIIIAAASIKNKMLLAVNNSITLIL